MIRILVLYMFFILGCSEAFRPRSVENKPFDDDEGVPGYLDRQDEKVHPHQSFVVTLSDYQVSGAEGSVAASAQVSLRTHQRSNELVELSGVDLDSHVGDPVEVLFYRNNQALAASELLKPFKFASFRDETRDSQILIVRNPGGQDSERSIVSSKTLALIDGNSEGDSAEVISFFLKANHAMVFFLADSADTKSLKKITINSDTGEEAEAVESLAEDASIQILGVKDSGFSAGLLNVADINMGSIMNACVRPDSRLIVLAEPEIPSQLKLFCVDHKGELCADFGNGGSVQLQGSAGISDIGSLMCGENNEVYYTENSNTSNGKIKRVTALGVVDTDFTISLSSSHTTAGTIIQLTLLKENEFLVHGSDQPDYFYQWFDAQGSLKTNFGADGHAIIYKDLNNQRGFTSSVYGDHAYSLGRIGVVGNKFQLYISDLNLTDSSENVAICGDPVASFYNSANVMLSDGQFLIPVRYDDGTHKAYLFTQGKSSCQHVTIAGGIDWGLHGHQKLYQFKDKSILYARGEVQSKSVALMKLIDSDSGGQNYRLEPVKFQSGGDELELECTVKSAYFVAADSAMYVLCGSWNNSPIHQSISRIK